MRSLRGIKKLNDRILRETIAVAIDYELRLTKEILTGDVWCEHLRMSEDEIAYDIAKKISDRVDNHIEQLIGEAIDNLGLSREVSKDDKRLVRYIKRNIKSEVSPEVILPFILDTYRKYFDDYLNRLHKSCTEKQSEPSLLDEMEYEEIYSYFVDYFSRSLFELLGNKFNEIISKIPCEDIISKPDDVIEKVTEILLRPRNIEKWMYESILKKLKWYSLASHLPRKKSFAQYVLKTKSSNPKKFKEMINSFIKNEEIDETIAEFREEIPTFVYRIQKECEKEIIKRWEKEAVRKLKSLPQKKAITCLTPIIRKVLRDMFGSIWKDDIGETDFKILQVNIWKEIDYDVLKCMGISRVPYSIFTNFQDSLKHYGLSDLAYALLDLIERIYPDVIER